MNELKNYNRTQATPITQEMSDLIMESSLVGYWVWDIKNDIEFLSTSFKNILGYSDEDPGTDTFAFWNEQIHPQDVVLLQTNLDIHIASRGKELYDQVIRYKHKKGHTLWVRCKGKVVEWAEDNKPEKLIGCTIEMPAEVQQEFSLKEEANIHSLALSSSGVGIWQFSIKENRMIWSDEMYQLYGRKKNDFNNEYNAWINAIHSVDIGRVEEEMKQAISRKKNLDTKYKIVQKDAKEKIIKSHAVVISDSQNVPVRMVGTSWDITELVKTNEELEMSRNQFHGAFKYSAIGMALISLQGEWLKVNDKVCQMTGYTESELMAKTFQDITHPDDLNNDLNYLNQILNGDIPSYQMEKRYYHKNGGIVWILLSVSLVRDINGSPLHFVSQIEDITDRVEAKKSLDESFQMTKKQNERLMNFAHIVSHNLRSHTGNLSMMLGFLAEETEKEKKESILKYIREIAETLGTTVEHLTEVVKIQANVGIKKEPLDLNAFISKTQSALKADIVQHNVEFDLKISEEFMVDFNSAYLDSVLLNLFTNCIKYRDKERNLVIEIASGQRENFKYFSVADNGLGINLTRHGKKLFGLNKTFHRNKDARGVGLFITKNQVESLGGKIEVESEEGKGSKFIILLQNEI